MSLWMVIVLLGLVKLPVAALMLWIPFRDDQAMSLSTTAEADGSGASEDDGGSMALGASPLDPHPRSPRTSPRRRGPHGSGTPYPSPPRIRRPAVPGRLRTTMTPARGHSAEAQRAWAQRLRLR
jgi:hypothetical protein